MVTSSDKERIEDYFSASELVDYLNLKVWQIIEVFEEEVDDALEDINELMGVSYVEDD